MVGLDRGRQGRIARNKKARTGRASWVFRRLSGTGLDSYLVGRGNLNMSIKLLILIDKYRLSIFLEYLLEYPSMNLNSGRFGLRKLIVSRGKACALSHSV